MAIEIDVKSQLTNANEQPERAASNINEARALDLDPDGYSQIAPAAEAQLKTEREPAQATPRVSQMLSKSQQHASVMKPDLEQLNWFEKQMNFAGKQIQGTGINREISDLAYRKARGEMLSEEEIFELDLLNHQMSSLSSETERLQLGTFESLPGNVVAAGVDIVRGLRDNYEKIVALGATGAAGGASVGVLFGGLAGAGVGAIAGGIRGTLAGGVVAGVADTYKQTTGSIYNELDYSVDDQGQHLNISEYEKQSIAKGAGAISATIGLVTNMVAVKTIPWLAKGIGLKALFRPENAAWLNVVRSISVSGLSEAIGEGSQEAVAIVASEVGQTWDGKETSLISGLRNAAAQWQKYSGRVGEAALTGAVAGGAFTGAGLGVGKIAQSVRSGRASVETGSIPIERDVTPTPAPRLEAPVPPQGSFDVPQQPVKPPSDLIGPNKNLPNFVRGTRALQLQIALTEGSMVTKDTGVKKLVPQELNEIRRSILEDAGIPYVWIDVEDLRKYSTDEEKGQRARALLDDSGIAASQSNAPIRIEAHRFLELVDDDPSIAGVAKASPEDMSADQFMAYFEAQEQKRKAILEGAPQNQGDLQTFADAQDRIVDQDIFNEQDYLSQATFTPEMEEWIPQKERDKFNEMQKQARLSVIEAIDDAAEKEMNQVLDVVTEIAIAQETEIQAQAMVNDPRIQMVEDFLNDKFTGPLSLVQEARKKRGRPIYAIDYSTLSPQEQARFKNVGTLKKRKVFAKDGLPIWDAVAALGAKNRTELLENLANAPTRQEAIDQAVAMRTELLKVDAEMSVDLNETAIAKAYNNMALNHKKEIEIVLSKKNWPNYRQSIYRASQNMKSDTLNARAKNVIYSTPIRGLNANQWKVGERRSQSAAMKAILKNEVEQYVVHKEEAGFNAYAAKEAHLATGKVNRGIRKMKRILSPEVQQELKDAGKNFFDPVADILESFNFIPKDQNAERTGSYQKFIKAMIESGNGNFEIPPEVQRWLTPKTSAKDLTVDQFLYLVDRMENVLKQARLKNQLIAKYRENQINQSTEIISEALHENAITHPKYDPERAVRESDNPAGTRGIGERIDRMLRDADKLIKNMQFITLELDQGVLNGIWSKMIYHPIKGIGKYQGAFGETAANKLRAEVMKEFDKHVETYGRKEWRDLGITEVYVPEFEGVSGLKGGKLTKIDLVMMLANMGNDENMQALTNFGVDLDTIRKVITREMTTREADLVQGMWNIFESLAPQLVALEKMTKGSDLELTQATPFELGGKQYRGGHFPLMYTRDFSTDVVRAMADNLFKKADEAATPIPTQGHSGIVRSPHTKERTGSSWHVNLGFEVFSLGVENTIYDLRMRVPVRDTMQLLQTKQIADDIMSIVGPSKYRTLVDSVAESTNSLIAENLLLYSDHQKTVLKAVKHVEGATAVIQIAYNATSVAIQFDSMKNVFDKMGVVSGSKHIGKAIATITNPLNWNKWGEFYEFAAEINSGIAAYREGIDDVTLAGLSEYEPKKRGINYKPWHLLRNAQEWSTTLAFQKILGSVDVCMKVATAIGAYNQYLAGEAPGHPIEKVMAMSEVDRYANAKAYAEEISNSSLTAGTRNDRASIQKQFTGRFFTKYWNDARNSLNSRIQITRNIGYDVKKSVELAKQGEYEKANDKFWDAGEKMTRMLFLAGVGIAFRGILYGRGEEEEDEDQIPAVLNPLEYGNEMFTQHAPVLRDIIFAGTSLTGGDVKTAATPMTRAMSDAATALNATWTFYQDLSDQYTFIEAAENMSQVQQKAIISTTSLMAGGLPVNAAYKYYNFLRDLPDNEGMLGVAGNVVLGTVVGVLKSFIEKFDQFKEDESKMTEEQLMEKYIKMAERSSEMQAAVEEAKKFLHQIAPEEPAGDELTISDFGAIKYAESQGKWNAQPYKRDKQGNIVFDENGLPEVLSNAFGIYQFVPKTWEDIRKQAPELKLTRNGRISKDTSQQEKAMRWLVNQSAGILRANGVPVNAVTIYGSHHFGPGKMVRIFKSKGTAKIKDVLRKEDIESNPWLKKYSTISQLRKYLDQRIAAGRKEYEEAEGSLTNGDQP